MDLDVDSQWLIIDELELLDLISMAEVNKHFLSLAQNALRPTLSKKTVIFASPYSTSHSNYNLYIQVTDDFIRIESLPIASKMLQYFGHIINSLRIDQYIMDNNADSIYLMVNNHCHATLHEIWLRNTRCNFTDWPVPFERVQKVHLDGYLKNLPNMKLNLSEIFPSMCQLILDKVEFSNTKAIELDYSHLELLEVDVSHELNEGRITETIVEGIVRKNQQIKVLILRNDASDEFQEFIKGELPNLERFEFVENEVDAYDEDFYD